MTFQVIDTNGQCFEIDDRVYQSKFLEDSNIEISISVTVESYYFDYFQLVNYIIFFEII